MLPFSAALTPRRRSSVPGASGIWVYAATFRTWIEDFVTNKPVFKATERKKDEQGTDVERADYSL
ncbi:hypothetical protein B0T26DRAFT_720333, partial [Lasiosphaeria miniovina]